MDNWKDIPGYEGIYKINEYGYIMNISTGNIRNLKPRKNGYVYVDLYKDGEVSWKRVHRIVALCFVPNPNNYNVVMHLDNDKSNNYYQNLKWGTVSENTQQAYDDGLLDTRDSYELYNDFICIECKGISSVKQKTGYGKTSITNYINSNEKLRKGEYKGFRIRKL